MTVMRVSGVVLLLLLSLWTQSSPAVLAALAANEQRDHQRGGVNDVKPVIIPLSPIVNKPVEDWAVSDVEYWMNYTVGYAEYSGFVRKHGVDGPTLMVMDASDFEEHFPIENAMHVIKLSAHLKLLQGICVCKTDDVSAGKIVDFWSYFRENNFRVWVVGGTSLLFPRVAMLYTFFFDDELYRMLLGVPDRPSKPITAAAAAANVSLDGSVSTGGGEYAPIVTTQGVSFLRTLLFLICLIAGPDLFFMVEAGRLVTTNYIIMPCYMLLFLFNAHREYLFLYLAYSEGAYLPGEPFYKKIWFLYSYTLFIPPLLIILYPVVPFTLQCIILFLAPVVFFLSILCLFCFLGLSSNDDSNNRSGNEKND